METNGIVLFLLNKLVKQCAVRIGRLGNLSSETRTQKKEEKEGKIQYFLGLFVDDFINIQHIKRVISRIF